MSCDGTMMVPPQNFGWPSCGPLFGLSGTKAESAKVTQSLFPPFHISCEPLQALELFGSGHVVATNKGTGPHMAVQLQDETSFDIGDTNKSDWFCSHFLGEFHVDIYILDSLSEVDIDSSCIYFP